MEPYSKLIDGADLEANLRRRDWRVVDCRFDLLHPDRGHAEYRAGHIPGAVYADLDRELASPVRPDSGRHPLPDPDAFVGTLRRWGISADTQVVVYDAGAGALAARLWWLLRAMSHPAVAVLDGGFVAWQRDGRPVTTERPAYAAGSVSGSIGPQRLVATDEVVRRLDAEDGWQLVDARDAARFAGRHEPIDAVAGHVPGALNFPFERNTGPDGRWLDARTLRERWAELLGTPGPRDWAVMCGSGVTACSLVLSAEIAGITPPRLYAGSWSEWIRDPARPVGG